MTPNRLEAQLASLDRGNFDPARADAIKRLDDMARSQQVDLDRVTAQARRMGCAGRGFFVYSQLALDAIHPARFPPGVPDFFVRFLTEPGQLVVDPFAGSNVTGHVAERLERRWIAVEHNSDYVAGSRLRFDEVSISSLSRLSAAG